MKHLEPQSDPTPCERFDAAVQALLDGDRSPLVPALDEHRSACAHCRWTHAAAIELGHNLPQLPRVAVPAGFAERVTAAVLNEHLATPRPVVSANRVRWAIAAVAACLLIAIGLGRPWSAEGRIRSALAARRLPEPYPKIPDDPPPVEVAQHQPSDAVPLRDRWAVASAAVASLSKRTAEQTVEPTRRLLPDQFEPPSLNVADSFPHGFEPAAQSLDEVRQGAAASLAPMANSARRAFSMLMREAPAQAKTQN